MKSKHFGVRYPPKLGGLELVFGLKRILSLVEGFF